MIAYNIFKANPSARVVMLEAREICSGATGRNGGHTKAASYRTYLQHKEELGKEEALKIARLEYANIIETHALAKELELECENQVCNTVDMIYDEQTFQAGKEAINELTSDATEEERQPGKMASYRIYEKDGGIKQKFWVENTNTNPAINKEENLAGAFEYLAGKVHAYRFTTGVLKHLVQKGLQLCANTPVHAFLPSQSSTEDSPLWDIFTQHTNLQARNVILATNGYTPYLLKSLQGIIVPLRGQITAQNPPPTARHPSVLPKTYSFIYGSGYEYMIPRQLPDGGQHIIIGGGLGRLSGGGACEFGTVDDSSLNPEVSKYLHGTLLGYFGAPTPPSSTEESPSYEIVHEWTGIMGATADGRPFVGQVPGQKGLWVSAGFNGHGMVLCLKAAEALVELMSERGDVGQLDWFPTSFLISEERVSKAKFIGRTDMQVPETGQGPVGHGES
ncbi:hypothetical protein N0V90_006954 [Kalmusia sp. IMI 367209]|nr:hypothetical protein N0V90_006954 [Kalmusia sp. IMI 367209]